MVSKLWREEIGNFAVQVIEFGHGNFCGRIGIWIGIGLAVLLFGKNRAGVFLVYVLHGNVHNDAAPQPVEPR